jgi:hypothetical protein
VVPEGIDLSFTERKTAPFGDAQPQIAHNPYVLLFRAAPCGISSNPLNMTP